MCFIVSWSFSESLFESSSFACCLGEFKAFNKMYRTTKFYSFSPATFQASASFEWHRLTKYSQQKWNSLHFHLIINLPLVLKCARCKNRRRVLSFVLKHLFLFVLFKKSVKPTHLKSVKKTKRESISSRLKKIKTNLLNSIHRARDTFRKPCNGSKKQ